jgi:hypothetical protein
MPDEDTARLALRTADQLRTDIANLECGQEFLMQRINQLPTARSVAGGNADRPRRCAPRDRRDRGFLALRFRHAVGIDRILVRLLADAPWLTKILSGETFDEIGPSLCHPSFAARHRNGKT